MSINGTAALAAVGATYLASYVIQSKVAGTDSILANATMGVISNLSALKVASIVALGSTGVGMTLVSVVATSLISALAIFILKVSCNGTIKAIKFGYCFFFPENQKDKKENTSDIMGASSSLV